jgi:putative DNA methylase
VKAEMSVATPKFQAKEPIQLDVILVCRKQSHSSDMMRPSPAEALDRARDKLCRLAASGFTLSRNDRRITLVGQLLTTLLPTESLDLLNRLVEQALDDEAFAPIAITKCEVQMSLFQHIK